MITEFSDGQASITAECDKCHELNDYKLKETDFLPWVIRLQCKKCSCIFNIRTPETLIQPMCDCAGNVWVK
jgi:hypothetical protein